MEKFVIKKGKKEFGIISYNKKTKNWGMVLNKNLDKSICPAFIYCLAIKNKYKVGNDVTLAFIKERILPAERQNISSILKINNIKEYDEYELLKLGKGKCTSDNCVVEYVKK